MVAVDDIDTLIEQAVVLKNALEKEAAFDERPKRCPVAKMLYNRYVAGGYQSMKKRYDKLQDQILHTLREIDDPSELERIAQRLENELDWEDLKPPT